MPTRAQNDGYGRFISQEVNYMAKNTTGTTVEATAAGEPKYTLDQLRKHTLELFGVETYIFDGATYGMAGEYSVEEIKNTIERWGKKEAK